MCADYNSKLTPDQWSQVSDWILEGKSARDVSALCKSQFNVSITHVGIVSSQRWKEGKRQLEKDNQDAMREAIQTNLPKFLDSLTQDIVSIQSKIAKLEANEPKTKEERKTVEERVKGLRAEKLKHLDLWVSITEPYQHTSPFQNIADKLTERRNENAGSQMLESLQALAKSRETN